MLRQMMKSKLHRCRVTRADLHYEGSVTIDPILMEAADIFMHEHVHVWNVTQGTRFETYAIPGQNGSGTIQVNGAAAHLAKEDDLLIITTFSQMPEEQAVEHEPTVVFVDPRDNSIAQVTHKSGHAAPALPH
jgi:aspartate 1-decarboxylase